MEVFSKRPTSSVLSKHELPAFSSLTPAGVQRLFVRRLSDICTGFDDWRTPMNVAGILGDVPEDCWRGRAATPLIDTDGEEEILLDMSPILLEREGLQAGDHVQVTGFLNARLYVGRVVARFEVLTISKDREKYAAQHDKELVQLMRRSVPKVRSFPTGEGARLFIVGVGIGPERVKHLSQSLGGFWTDRNTDSLLLSSYQVDELSYAITHMHQALLLLVVAEGALSVLEDITCLRGLSMCSAYRVVSCDWQEPNTEPSKTRESGMIVPYLVEDFFTNDVEAGEAIRQRTGQERQRKTAERAQEEELIALRASLASLTEKLTLSRRGPKWPALMIGIFLGGVLMFCGWWGVLALQHEGWLGRW